MTGKQGPPDRAHARQLLEPQRRPQRYVAVKVNGVWTDTGAMQLDSGLVLPDLHPDEYGNNLDYSRRAQAAAANRRRLLGLARRCCGVGPSQDDQLEVTVNWDADGNDAANVNGEWVDVVNRGANVVSLAGWWVRDAAYRGTKAHGYTFPAGAQVGARRAGSGSGSGTAPTTTARTTGAWTSPIFANVTGGREVLGDGAWMFDPQGDLRAWYMYPCRAAC